MTPERAAELADEAFVAYINPKGSTRFAEAVSTAILKATREERDVVLAAVKERLKQKKENHNGNT